MDTTRLWSWVTIGLLVPGITGCAWSNKTAQNGESKNPFASPKVAYGDGTSLEEADFPDKKVENPEQLKLVYAQWMEEVGNLDEARSHYLAVYETQPKNVEAIVGLARVERLQGKPSEARTHLEQALAINPKSVDAQFEMGRLHVKSEDWPAAVKALSIASAGRPEDTVIRHQLGVALVHTGEINAAQTQFAQSVGAAAGHYNTALILKDLGQLDQAEEQLRLALIKDPKLVEAQRWLVELQRQRSSGAAARSAPTNPAPLIEPTIAAASYRDLGPMGTVEVVPAVHLESDSVASPGGERHSRP